MTLDQYDMWLRTIEFYMPTGQRRGQWAFNSLHEVAPDIANKFRGSIRDPFNNDALIPEFIDAVLTEICR